MDFTGTKHTKGFIGTLPKEWTLEEIYEKLDPCNPLNVEVISSSKEQTCVFILCKSEKADSVFETLREIDFSLPGSAAELAPKDQVKQLNDLISEARMTIEQNITEIKAFKE
jgi:V/A-type H+-transporting ATPase subunit I